MADTKGLTKEMHRQIKHLDKAQMERYIRNIWVAGFEAGYKAAKEELAPEEKETAPAADK